MGIQGLKSMFEKKPMPVHTPSGQASSIKSLQASSAQATKPVPAPKLKPTAAGKVQMPDGLQKQLLGKQNLKSVPQPLVPKKEKRLSVDARGDLVKPSEILSKQTDKPALTGIKEKPKVLPKNFKPPVSASDNNKSAAIPAAKPLDTADKTNNNSLKKKQLDLEYVGDVITGTDNNKYRMIKCPPPPDSPPSKPRLPTKIDFEDILRKQYTLHIFAFRC